MSNFNSYVKQRIISSKDSPGGFCLLQRPPSDFNSYYPKCDIHIFLTITSNAIPGISI